MGMSIFWLAALIIFAVVEGLTVGLTSIWFALGALVALLASVAGAGPVLQVVLFLAVSFLALILIRPLSRKYLNKKVVATNADRNIGKEAIVTEEIDNLKARGHVSVDGVPWTARSEDESVIPEGATVRVVRIEGVKVYVAKEPAPTE